LVPDALRYLVAFARSGALPFVRQALGDVTLADVLARAARQRPDALALSIADERLTYRELNDAACAAARQLRVLGCGSGDVVALVGRNSSAYVAWLLGAARLGVTLALVHPELAAEPLRQALSAAGAKRVLCEAPLASAVQAASALPAFAFDEQRQDAWWSERGAAPRFAPDRRLRDFALVYTSGTTGLPKACRLPHSRVLAAACLFGAPLFDYRPSDKLLCALPLHHGSPLMLGLGACLITGTPLLLERRFSASEFMAVAARSSATVLLYVGDLGRMLLATPASARDRGHVLRLAVGNGMAPEVWTKFQARFGIAEVREFYAATESPVGLFNFSGRVGSVGNLPYAWMFGLKLAKFDESGALLRDARGRVVECADGEPGELLVRARRSGLGVYHGYVDGSATEARLVRSAFRAGDVMFRTGDVLRRDRDGFYYFVERRGDGYRFHGENVSAAQVERELLDIAGVRSALVTSVALPSCDGRAGVAVIVPAGDFDVARLERLRERLPRSALPRFVRLVAELPRTSSLKLKRQAWARDGVDPERVQDELWVLRDGSYRRLDAEAYRDVLQGRIRL
jgi:fatty-acyl-CoA synthase